jgi:hypothetical protein
MDNAATAAATIPTIIEGARVAVRVFLSCWSIGASVHDRLGRQASPDLYAPCLTWWHRDLASARISPLVWTCSDLQLRAVRRSAQPSSRRKFRAHDRRRQKAPQKTQQQRVEGMFRMSAVVPWCEPAIDWCEMSFTHGNRSASLILLRFRLRSIEFVAF